MNSSLSSIRLQLILCYLSLSFIVYPSSTILAHAIHKALTMDENEMIQRWNDLHRTVVTQTAQHWITSLLSRLERAHLEQQRRDNAFIPHLEIVSIENDL